MIACNRWVNLRLLMLTHIPPLKCHTPIISAFNEPETFALQKFQAFLGELITSAIYSQQVMLVEYELPQTKIDVKPLASSKISKCDSQRAECGVDCISGCGGSCFLGAITFPIRASRDRISFLPLFSEAATRPYSLHQIT